MRATTTSTSTAAAAILLIIPFIITTAADLDLLLLHNNDMHARFEETSPISGTCTTKGAGCVGGFARVAHIVRRARTLADEGRGRQVLFLNAGDTYTGTAWFSVYKWKIVADFLNLLQPDAMCLGNHEFDLHPSGLYPLLENLHFPVVGANVHFPSNSIIANTTFAKSIVIERLGRKIGIIGYLTPETMTIAATDDVVITDEIDALRSECQRLKKEGVGILIALGHSGYKKDLEIAEKVELVDLVVGGHTNTFLWNGEQPDRETVEGPYPKVVIQKSGRKVPVVQAYAYTKYIGQLNLTFDDEGELKAFSGQPLLLDSSIAQEKDVLQRLDIFRPEIEKLNTITVGTTKTLLDGGDVTCRHYECNFGNLIADALVDYRASIYGGDYWTDAPIGLINGGSIRNSIIKGNITRGDLIGCLPYDNQVITLSLTGKDLLKTLEIGARSNGETSMGEFLQVSGLQVAYDMSKPTGHRVDFVRVRCNYCEVPKYEQLQLESIYRLVTTGFLVSGGDGHYVLRNNSFDKVVEDLHDQDVVSRYLEMKSPVYPENTGRIVVVRGEGSGVSRNVAPVIGAVIVLVALVL